MTDVIFVTVFVPVGKALHEATTPGLGCTVPFRAYLACVYNAARQLLLSVQALQRKYAQN